MKLAILVLEQHALMAKAKVDDLPARKWKSPLQEAIQILKRHRDVMFQDAPDSAPISATITTLAALSYRGEPDVASALERILTDMHLYVRQTIPRVPNPVNPAEDFADKWYDPTCAKHHLEESFWTWLETAQRDFKILAQARDVTYLDEQVRAKFAASIDKDRLKEKLGLASINVVTRPKVHVVSESPGETLGSPLKSASSSIPGLGQFLADYPLMMFRPRTGKPPLLRGRFAFTARHREAREIEDAFDLEIEIPVAFPREVPLVTEIAGRIPREADYHVNTSDNTLCLGSPLRLRQLLAEDPTLTGFASKCLVPYLFAQPRKLAGGGDYPFGELAHGLPGMLDDYVALFGVKDFRQAVEALRLLGMKKRRANKLRCPCGCKKRLGRCRFNATLAQFREVASRPWFRAEREAILEVARQIAKQSKTAENLSAPTAGEK